MVRAIGQGPFVDGRNSIILLRERRFPDGISIYEVSRAHTKEDFVQVLAMMWFRLERDVEDGQALGPSTWLMAKI